MSPRPLCIAGDFTKFDLHAVQQINRNIELIRQEKYRDGLLLFELVNVTTAEPIPDAPTPPGQKPKGQATFIDMLAAASDEVRDRYGAIRAYLAALGDEVQEKQLKFYTAFRRVNNFACVAVHPWDGHVLIWVKVDPQSEELEEGFTRDVSSIGHFGTGNLEIRIKSTDDFERAKPYLLRSYEAS